MKNELAKNWTEVELEELISFVVGGDWGKEENYENEEYTISYCIRGSEIKNWNKDFGSTAVLRKLKKSSIETRKLLKNDILLEISGGGPEQPVGRVVYIENNSLNRLSDYPIVCTNFLRLLRPIDKIESKYLFRYLEKFYFSGEVIKYQGGSNNLRNLKYKEFEKIKIPLPPLPEQERIVTKLDALFAQHEAMKKALERIPQLLKDFRQQVLIHAVTGKLTEEWRNTIKLDDSKESILKIIAERNKKLPNKDKIIFRKIDGNYPLPKNWNFGYLNYFGEVSRGKSKHRPRNDKKLFGGNYPFIQTGDVSNSNNVITKYSSTYNDFGLKQSRLFPKGTLCITIAANIAETGILNFDACFPDSVVGYIPYKNIYSSIFAMYFLKTIQKDIEKYAPATAQKNINLSILNEIAFPFPPIEEQQEIVSRTESLFTKAESIEKRYQILKEKIDNLPQAILHKAFKGELVPQLPTDGDAKDLLEEILKLKKEVKKK
ncbi:restriction endonuclease subunit S [Elizabethkingia anophelis]|jgi:type I restriction enzyme S subunit|nr:restriction endonuclease subunit S [Elizabethkingia anophelis]